MRRNTTYVPDELWIELGKSIHHFEYDVPEKGISTAVYNDGHTQEFNSVVTKKLISEESEKWRMDMRERAARGECFFYEFKLKVENPAYHHQIYGIN